MKEKIKGSPLKNKGGMMGGLLIRDLWTQEKDSIHNMLSINTDTTSYQSKNSEKLMEAAEKENKKKYPDVCIKQRWKCTPFVASVGVLLRVKADATLKRISSRLTTK